MNWTRTPPDETQTGRLFVVRFLPHQWQEYTEHFAGVLKRGKCRPGEEATLAIYSGKPNVFYTLENLLQLNVEFYGPLCFTAHNELEEKNENTE